MWMLKGISVGLGVFFIGSLIYIVIAKLAPIEEHKATGLSVITGSTVYHPWWWMALVTTLALSCWFFKMYEPGATMVINGILFVFGIFVVALVAVIVVTRGLGAGVEFNVSYLAKIGMFLIGCGIGSTILGGGLLLIGRVAAASLARHLAR